MDNVVNNPITGKTKFTITDDGVFNAITGRQVGVIVDGMVVSPVSGQPFAIVVQNSEGGVDLSFITATASDILSGKVGADSSGNPVNGTITKKSAATITPGTADQTIAAGTYLSGKQTIKGDADLIASNIKKGVKIFNVTGDYEGEGSGETFNLAKVTQYSPATPAVQLVTSVDISGIEDLIWSDDPDSEDYEYNMYYSDANGAYNVTSETAGETDWRNRIYKHESKEYYLWYEYFDDWPEESTWFIGESIGEGFVRKYNDYDWETDETLPVGDLESGTSDWGDYDWEPFSVTLDVHTVEIPATNMVLKGVMATGYANGEWSFDTTEVSFSAFEKTPKVDFIYASTADQLIGAYISFAGSIPTEGLVFYAPLTSKEAAAETGQALQYKGNVSFSEYGVYLNDSSYIETTDNDSDFAVGTSGTLSACFTPSGFGDNQCIVTVGTRGDGGREWNIYLRDRDISIGKSGSEVDGYTDCQAGTKYHALAVAENGKLKFYLNGEFVKELNFPVDCRSTKISIGSHNGGECFTGTVSSVRLYNRALTDEEIRLVAKDGLK